MINVITVEREFGSGGGDIASALAKRLGWTLWDRDISREIAKRLKCDVASVEQREERLDPTYYRLVKVFMRGSYEASFSGARLELLDAEGLFRLFEQVITEIAARGSCVIVGRGGSYFLRNHDNVFRLFVYGTAQDKLRRLIAAGRSHQESVALLEEVDRERAAFVRKYHGKDWPLRELYHLMVNSSVGDAIVQELVINEIALLSAPAHAGR